MDKPTEVEIVRAVEEFKNDVIEAFEEKMVSYLMLDIAIENVTNELKGLLRAHLTRRANINARKERKSEDKANATLPDLLQACKTIVANARKHPTGTHTYEITHFDVEVLEKAIAEATE